MLNGFVKKLLTLVNMSINKTALDKPLVVVLGSTGTGKTKLSVEIASKYNGEVINSDAMQMYKGLDITTNKATEEECRGIPHHMIGTIEPCNRSTAISYRNQALEIINELHNKKKLPIIVGGTNYYIESILFDLMSGYWEESYSTMPKVGKFEWWGGDMKKTDVPLCNDKTDLRKRVQNILNNEDSSPSEVYKMLEEVDPNGAATYHHNDVRKVVRSLDVWLKTGRRLSDIYAQQQERVGGKALGGSRRFENVLLLWLKADRNVLEARLTERVGDMMYRGLMEEVEEFHKYYNKTYLDGDVKYDKTGMPMHYQQGVFQCIGFKEFHNYLILDQKERDTKKGRARYLQAVQLMTQRTCSYANNQNKWIRNRLLIRDRVTFPVYGLDTTEPEKWDENVTTKVDKLMEAFLSGDKIPFENETLEEAERPDYLVSGDKTRYNCEICDQVLRGKVQYDVHINGKRHKKVLKQNARKREKLEAAIAQEENETPSVVKQA